MAKAVRAALAASALLLASGTAAAGACDTPTSLRDASCSRDAATTSPYVDALFTVVDLTLAIDGGAPSSVASMSSAAASGTAAVGTGSIGKANKATNAFGIYSNEPGNPITISNVGDLTAVSSDGIADGIFAAGATVNVDNAATGTIAADGFAFAAGIEAQASGDTTVTNSGKITARSTRDPASPLGTRGNYAYGIYATGSSVVINNADSGEINVAGTTANGIRGYASVGSLNIDNRGIISARGELYANGILAVANNGNITITNSGDVSSAAIATQYAINAIATGQGASVNVANTGTVRAESVGLYNYGATGIRVSGDGNATVGNAGTVYVYANGQSIGMQATAFNGTASAVNTGTLTAKAPRLFRTIDGSTGFVSGIAIGVYSASVNGAAIASNTGTLTVLGTNTAALAATGATQAVATNTGTIDVTAKYAQGVIQATSTAGDVSVRNEGTIRASDLPTDDPALVQQNRPKYFYAAAGVSTSGDISVVNTATGNVDIHASVAVGLLGSSTGESDMRLENAGTIVAEGQASTRPEQGQASGIVARAVGGDVTAINTGRISARSYEAPSPDLKFSYALGIQALSTQGNVDVINTGAIVSRSDLDGNEADLASETGGIRVQVAGITASAPQGLVSITNSGSISSAAVVRNVLGIAGLSTDGAVAITNSGDINVVGEAGAVTNTGPVGTNGYSGYYGVTARGVQANGGTSATVTNTGTINAVSRQLARDDQAGAGGVYGAYGIDASATGNVTVTNAGSITASDADHAIAVSLNTSTGVATFNNRGTVNTVSIDAGRIAVRGSDSVDQIVNTGTITGALLLRGGADTLANGSGGRWNVIGQSTDFGDGADVIRNEAGGTIALDTASFTLGAGDNVFDNLGTIRALGTSTIDLGTGAAPLALNNRGVIDLSNGIPGDQLTLVGDLAGNGGLSVDLNTTTGASDTLNVDGNVVGGSVQQVNIVATRVPSTASGTPFAFARVSGTAAADAFVGGTVLDASPSNFLAFGVDVTRQLEASTGDSLFQAQVDVNGLNDTGVLASSIASGVQNLMTSQIGTWRQRVGVIPRSDDTGLSAFVRTFRDQGDIDSGHEALNFGQAGNFGYEQTNTGTEVGLNFEPAEGFNLGVTFAKADGKQRLSGAGVGIDTIESDTAGLYATWISGGFYVDGSYRAMDFKTRLQSAAGLQRTTDGQAGAFNLESGYAWTLENGLRIEPQLQYTWTTVDGVFLQGQDAFFRSQDADWHRGRVGVAAWMPFQTGGGMTFTPYAAVSAVHTADGAAGYAINDTFLGKTDTDGSSALAELGLGVNKAGFSATAGANWADGGSLDRVVGGQVVVRYDW